MNADQEFAIPHGPTFVPIETATLNDDVMFNAFNDCQSVKLKHKNYVD